MQKHMTYLVVEDDENWSKALSECVRSYFRDVQNMDDSRILNVAAYNGNDGNKHLSEETFDLVTLDMNLGEGTSLPRISGLNLLGEIAESNSAYFVIIVTGAVNDPKLEALYGRDAAAIMRFAASNAAIKLLPAERVCILHKPSKGTAKAGMKELVPHLCSALDQYCRVSRERNIFRPLPGYKTLWEVRYDGGKRITVPGIEPFEMIRSVLSTPNEPMNIIGLMQAIAQSSGTVGAILPSEQKKVVDEYDKDDETGIDWDDRASTTISTSVFSDAGDTSVRIDALIGGLLDAQRRGMSLSETLTEYEQAFTVGPLLRIPSGIAQYCSDSHKADADLGSIGTGAALAALGKALSPLIEQYRLNYKKALPAGLVKEKKIRVATGKDTPEFELARQHWKRFLKAVEFYPDLREFRSHVEAFVDRGRVQKGYIQYCPPGGDKAPFWLTE